MREATPSLFSRFSRRTSLIVLLIGSVLWLSCFNSFLTSRIVITGDTLTNYCILKYYFNNILNGVFPLWDPFVYLGRPFVYLASSGALNPFAYLMPLLYQAGLDYYQAYLAFISVYFLFGVIGFYFLAGEVLKSEFESLLAALLVMFCGFGPMLFNQVFVIYLFVPAVWFFYFLLRFAANPGQRHFVGMTAALALVMVSYFPFYFVTLFLLFAILCALLFFSSTTRFLKDVGSFAVRCKLTFAVCVLAVAVSTAPLVMFKKINDKQEFISPGRHINEEQKQEGAKMTLTDAAYRGTLAERMKGGRLFSHLGHFSYFSDDFFYVPMLAWIMIAVAAFAAFSRRQLFLFLFGLSLFLLSFGAATPIYGFLFDHVFYFKLYRNLFFYMAFVMPVIVLFAAVQLKALRMEGREGRRKFLLTAMALVHAAFLILLAVHGHILIASYITVVLSFVFFSLLLREKPPAGTLLLGLVVLAAVLEPAEVFMRHAMVCAPFNCTLPSRHSAPEFRFVRPSKDIQSPCLVGSKISGYNFFIHLSAFRDTSGLLIRLPDFVSKDLAVFLRDRGREAASKYVHSKIWVYDGNDASGEATAVDAGSPQFSVTRFDANAIEFKTDFSTPKFIVYTDAYSSDWKAVIDGQPAVLQKSNSAFKGIPVGGGPHTLVMTYKPAFGAWPYLITLFVIAGLMVWWMVLRKEPQRDKADSPQPLKATALAYYLVGGITIFGIVNFSMVHYIRGDHLAAVYFLGEMQPVDGILYYDYRVHVDPADAEAYAELAKNYFLAGELEDARKAFDDVVRLSPERLKTDEGLQILGRKLGKL